MCIRRLQPEGRDCLQVWFDEIQRAGKVTSGDGIHQDNRLIRLGEGICQVVRTNTKIGYQDLLRKVSGRQSADDLDAKGVIAQENVSHPGHQYGLLCLHAIWELCAFESDAGSRSAGSTSSIAKKNLWPGWRSRPRSFPGSASRTTARWI